MDIEIDYGADQATHGIPYDWYLDRAHVRTHLALLREKRQHSLLTEGALVQEAFASAQRLAEGRGLWYAGWFEEGTSVVVQWRDRATARRLLGWREWPWREIERWWRRRKEGRNGNS